jgi:CelD/BcsL family acetyltransferase involved in cellulose biosynthesis
MRSLTTRPTLEAIGGDTRQAWQELVEQNPGLALSKTPEWLDCIQSSTRITDASLLFRLDDGRRVLLPRLRSPGLAGVFASPPDYWNLGADASGFLTEGGRLQPKQVRGLVAEVTRAGVRTKVMVGGDDAAQWQPAVPARIHRETNQADVLALDGGFSAVWEKRFRSKVRSACRKAERRGVTIVSDSTGELIPAFDTLYRSSVRRWARDRRYPIRLMEWRYRRTHPRSRFESVAQALGAGCTVWMASWNGAPVASIIVLTRGDQVTYWRGAMDKERCRGSGANELLHRYAIEAACDEGRSSYDFGVSQIDDLRRFKRTFGTHQIPVSTYVLERIPIAAAEARCYETAKGALLAVSRRLNGHAGARE